ncbi:MAG: ABC transporter ATP-binding protein [Flavobacterium sp.]
MQNTKLLEVRHLSVSFQNEMGFRPVIHEVEFHVNRNEILGIVGESGSGKSVTTLALMGLLPVKKSKLSSGEILFDGQPIHQLSESEWRTFRGNKISMIFQEPMSSLNPSMTCGEQVAEILEEHTTLSKNERNTRVLELFEQVKLPNPDQLYHRYPHEISGGQKQRVMIAMAIACEPQLLIADEPTTALDVTVQKEIIELLKQIQKKNQMSILFISHDLSLVSEIAQRVLVMYQGKVVEQGTIDEIFNHPKELYTRALIASRPSMNERLKRLPTIQGFLEGTIEHELETPQEREQRHRELYQKQPILTVHNLNKTYLSRTGWWGKSGSYRALNEVSFEVYEGETLGLVGESGCGKSTLGNALLLLNKADSGEVFYRGKDITNLSTQEERKLRKEIQIIFQDPFSSLNPRITVGKAIMEPMEVYNMCSGKKERYEKVIELLKRVGLTEEHFSRYPHEFSGGQRQRIGIARAIALMPKFIICDESVSALDISVQAQVLNLLNELKDQFGFTYLFISHDLAVVKYMADRIMVMQQGQNVELKEADTLYQQPSSAYTQKLIDAIPGIKST